MLANLNIIFTEPTQQAPSIIKTTTTTTATTETTKPKKKRNKYERRRHLAQKAKKELQQQNQRQTTQKRTNEEEQASNEMSVKDIHENDRHMKETSQTTNDDHKDWSPNRGITNEEKISDTIMETDPTSVAIIPNESITTTALPPTSVKTENKEQETEGVEEQEEFIKPSRRRHHHHHNDATTNDKNSQEHAMYLAEFHARPMELDRRSGAHSRVVPSYDSKHLMDNNHQWTDLPLHPRLIQTMTQHFQLSQPTKIQTKAIITLLSSRNESENAENSNSSNNKDDAKLSNLLLQSETGSGKTLAYALPVLQSLAVDAKDSDGSIVPRRDRKQLGTKCVILCPTRELANQTFDMLEQLCQQSFRWLVPGCLSGGDARKSEKARIRKGLGIVVATPGRFLDHLDKTEALLLSLKGNLEWMVLDEADRLLDDMGLGDQVRQIVQRIRANEATSSSAAAHRARWRSILVSATVTPAVQSLAQERMLCGDRPWVWITSGGSERETTGHSTITSERNTPTTTSPATFKDLEMDSDDQQRAPNAKSENDNANPASTSFSESTPRQLAQQHLTVSAKLRLSTLVAFLAQRVAKQERTVVFMATCSSVDFYYKLFGAMESILDKKSNNNNGKNGDGVAHDDDDDDDAPSASGIFGSQCTLHKLHGNIPHSERQLVLKDFAKAPTKSCILLATDVAARGLNLARVDWTVQYDPPSEIADYVHRVGRVARAGKAGHSLLMILPSERSLLDVLQSKGVSNLSPVSLASTLNQAAMLCTEVTKAGMKFMGNKESTLATQGSRLGEAFGAEIQRRLEDCLIQEDSIVKTRWKEARRMMQDRKRKHSQDSTPPEGTLLTLARDAFIGFLRAYSTKEKCVRPIFSARALHLGHVARSFALKEPPKSLAFKQKRQLSKEGKEKPSNLAFQRKDDIVFSDNNHEEKPAIEKEARTSSMPSPLKKARTSKAQPDKYRALNNSSKERERIRKAKELLLFNAAKIQTNGLDAM